MRYHFGEFVLDLETGALLRNGAEVELRRQTFALLKLLVERAPALLSHDVLLDEVWGRTALSANALPQTISELRRALGDSPDAPRYIENRRGRGYRLLTPVRRESSAALTDQDSNSDIEIRSVAPSPALHTAKPWLRSGWHTALIVVSSALLLATSWIWWPDDHGALPIGAAQTPQSAPIVLALSRWPATDAVPDWIPLAAPQLLLNLPQTGPLQFVRADALGPFVDADSQRASQVAKLLGATHMLHGRWQSSADGKALSLDLTLIRLVDDHVLHRGQLQSSVVRLDRLLDAVAVKLWSALQLGVPPPAVVNSRTTLLDDRLDYWKALAALERGDASAAASTLRDLSIKLQTPAWLELDLARALAAAGAATEAAQLLEQRAQRTSGLATGERLRLQAQAAQLRFRPADAAAALRALVELAPQDVASWIALVDSELDALQGSAARRTLARLTALPAFNADPRLELLRARLALLDNDQVQASAAAGRAMQLAIDHELPELALLAAAAQADALHQQGDIDAAARVLQQADARWSQRAHDASVLNLRLRQVRLLRGAGQQVPASALLEPLHALARIPTDHARIAIELALLQVANGQSAAATSTLQAVEFASAQDADPDLAISWHDAYAMVLIDSNDLDGARQQFDAAFVLAQQRGRERQSVGLKVNAGMLLARQRRFVEADALWQQALAVFEQLGDRRGQATALGNLAASASSQGQAELATELNQRALHLFRKLNLPGPRARIAYNLALNAARKGQLSAARDGFEEAVEAWGAEGQIDAVLRARVGQAQIALHQGDWQRAEQLLQVDDAPQGSVLVQAQVLATRADLLRSRADLQASRVLQTEALTLQQNASSRPWAALSELALLRLDLLEGADAAQVQVKAEALATEFQALREIRDVARAWLLVAEAQLVRGQVTDANRSLVNVRDALDLFADASVELDLDWVRAWATAAPERRIRLDALQSAAQRSGYLAMGNRAEMALSVVDGTAPGQPLPADWPAYARKLTH